MLMTYGINKCMLYFIKAFFFYKCIDFKILYNWHVFEFILVIKCTIYLIGKKK